MITISLCKTAEGHDETGKPSMVVTIKTQTKIPNGYNVIADTYSLETQDELVALASVLEYLKAKRDTEQAYMQAMVDAK